MSDYLDMVAFQAEADRLFGLYLRLRTKAKAAGIEIETAILRAAEAGEISPDDAEMLRLALSGKPI